MLMVTTIFCISIALHGMTLQRASLLGLPLLVRLSHSGVFQASILAKHLPSWRRSRLLMFSSSSSWLLLTLLFPMEAIRDCSVFTGLQRILGKLCFSRLYNRWNINPKIRSIFFSSTFECFLRYYSFFSSFKVLNTRYAFQLTCQRL